MSSLALSSCELSVRQGFCLRAFMSSIMRLRSGLTVFVIIGNSS
jgi:hypothetical protein